MYEEVGHDVIQTPINVQEEGGGIHVELLCCDHWIFKKKNGIGCGDALVGPALIGIYQGKRERKFVMAVYDKFFENFGNCLK
jgi:hypothetical protein